MFGRTTARHQRLKKQPFPVTWDEILKNDVSYFHRLPASEQNELRGHIQVFIAEKNFEGCDGLEITERIRVVVAAQACILLLHRDTGYYPTLRTILVYPHPYVSPVTRIQAGGVITEERQGRLGESWRRGPVVLAWDEVTRTAHDHHDGHNVVFHEFPHQLDGEWGDLEGAPALPKRSMYIAWARVLGEEYQHLLKDLELQHQTDLDAYGATSPAEFFCCYYRSIF